MTIGDKIKKIRTFRNMTQAELGAALGCIVAQLSRQKSKIFIMN